MTAAIIFFGVMVLALGGWCANLHQRISEVEVRTLELQMKLDKALHPAYRPGLQQLARDLTEEVRRGK